MNTDESKYMDKLQHEFNEFHHALSEATSNCTNGLNWRLMLTNLVAERDSLIKQWREHNAHEERQQQVAEEYQAAPEHSEFYKAWNNDAARQLAALDFDESKIPQWVLNHAQSLENWMQLNHHKYWALRGVCDRRFASKIEEIESILKRK